MLAEIVTVLDEDVERVLELVGLFVFAVSGGLLAVRLLVGAPGAHRGQKGDGDAGQGDALAQQHACAAGDSPGVGPVRVRTLEARRDGAGGDEWVDRR